MANPESKTCQNCRATFVIAPDDFSFYKKINVPPPTWCWECRMMRRFVFRNHRKFFKRREQIFEKEILSSFPEAVASKIYELSYWNSDQWDPLDYGREYDFSRPFFEQFMEFYYSVPWPSRSVLNMVNSEYCDQASYCKNSYLCFDMDYAENSAYCVRGREVKDSFDLYEARHTELSYENFMSDESYHVFFSVNVEDSTDVWFSRNLIGCNNCFGCVNLRNQSHQIFNKKVSKEEYAAFIKNFNFGSFAKIRETQTQAHRTWLNFPMRFTLGINNVNSWGEHIEHSKNVKASFEIHDGEDLKYCQIATDKTSDSYDYTVWGDGASRMYESLTCGLQADNIRFSFNCWPSVQNIEYSADCRGGSDLFACACLKKKQYCIFNKQYSKEEYFKLREKIIAHMNEMPYTDKQGRVYKYGEFFPPEFSPFAYNETIAQDFFPLTKEQAEAKGYLWRELEAKEFQATVKAADLPDNIKDVTNDILKEIIACESCGKAYRVIQMELDFYRRIPLPVPRKCPECRFKDRFKFVNPPKFWPAKCECAGTSSEKRKAKNEKEYVNAVKHFHGEEHCPNEFETSYPPDSPSIIYCEQCYNAEVA